MQKPYNYFRSELKSKNIARYKLIGISTEIILDDKIFKKNEELSPFLRTIYNLSFKDYIMKSRTLIIARTSRVVYQLDDKEVEELRRKLLMFINGILELKDTNKDNNGEKKDFTKWMDGIADVEA